jgi:hypothetical protein
MASLMKQLKPFLLAVTLLSLTSIAACSPPWARKADFELTGQVLDFDTKQPIAGAYVLAVYEKVDLGIAGAARYCVKTKGMLSDKDGSFHFPIDKLDGNSPHMVYAIKADYFLREWELPPSDANRAQTKQAYTNRHVYLKRQEVGKPSFQHGFSLCERAPSSEAVESAVTFLEIMRVEERKYFPENKSGSVEYAIKRMKNPNERVN